MTLNDDELRRVLEQQAAQVEFAPDALGTIRRRITTRRTRWWLTPRSSTRPRGGAMFAISTGTGVAVAATVVATVVGIGSCAPAPTTTTTNHSPAASPTGGRTASPTSGATTASTATVSANVPVYYIGGVDGRDLLYREFHRMTVTDSAAGRVKAGLVEMIDGRHARNPGYFSSWPASAAIGNVTVSGGIATVDLGSATVNAYDPDGNRAAIAQLVWTATAVPGVTGVRLLFDGRPRTTVWKSKQLVGGTLKRASAVNTLAPVWIIDPQAGATSGTLVTFHLAGIVFEGTIQLRVRDHTGKVVSTKVVQLTVGSPAQGTATVKLTLAPGSYTAEAYYVSLKDSSLKGMDRHPFTVK
jgi:spore germination protein GerM